VRIVYFFSILAFLFGCTKSEDTTSVENGVPVYSISSNTTIDLNQITSANNFLVYPKDAIDLGIASILKPKIELSLFLTNSSSSPITYKFKFPSKNGFSMKKNLCLETIQPNSRCEISVLFDSTQIKDGTYNESIEISNDKSAITTLFTVKVVDRPQTSTGNTQTIISTSMREGFVQGTSLPYRGITITNSGNTAAQMIITLPLSYTIRSNQCSSVLNVGESCYLEVLYEPYKTLQPVFGLMYIRGNFPEKAVNLLSGSGNVTFLPIYSNYSPNPLTPCQGNGTVSRTIQECQVLVDNVNYGRTELSQCDSFLNSTNLEKSVKSPSGFKILNIANGTRKIYCLEGENIGLETVICNTSYHTENGACAANQQICSVPNGVGQKNWTGNSYTACIVQTCSSSYHIENNACINNTYLPIYDSNNLSACQGQSVQFPIGCKESWGQQNSTDISYCIGQSRVIQSPAGVFSLIVPNGQMQTQCATGQTTGSQTLFCNSGFHNENGSCVSNTQACVDVPNSTAGTKTWNGTSYNSCKATACISNYHVESGLCSLNTYTPIYPSNPLLVCDGTQTGINPVNCRENWGSQNITDASNCFSQKGTYVSPSGIRTLQISNGSRDVFCSAGSTVQSLVAIRCDNENSPNGYHSDGNGCVLNKINCSPTPTGSLSSYRLWNSTNLNYDSCQIDSCDSSYVLLSNSCVLRTYNAQYPVNTLLACDGQRVVSAEKCFEAWGNQSETLVSFCSGMIQTQLSPAGSVLSSITNGQKLTDCLEGSSAGTETLLCNSGFHSENGSCVSDLKSCSSSELLAINATNGYKSWLGSSYSSCQITSCDGQNNIDGSGYHLEGNSCVSNTTNCSASELSFLSAIGGTKLWTGSSYGACLVNSCSGESNTNGTGYHIDLANNRCQPNSVSCSSGELNLLSASSGIKIWNGSTYGICQISSCLGETNTNGTGYHLSSGSCVLNQTTCSSSELLSINATNGVKYWQGSSFGSCLALNCSGETNSDGSGYHLEGSSCALNQTTCSALELSSLNATNGLKKWNGSTSFGSCQITACSGQSSTDGSGYHLDSGSCVSNQISCSPSELLSLNATSGTKKWDGSTSFGSCQITACSGESNTNGTGYHLSSGSCISNQTSCLSSELSSLNASSGYKNWAGTIFGSCQITSCNSNYHQSGNSCSLNTYNAIFSNNTLQTCDGTVTFYPIDCRESWSSNSVAISFCSGQTVNYQSPAGTIITTIPHGFRTDTCAIGSSIASPSIATCTEPSYVASGSICIYNSAPTFSGNLTLSGLHFQTKTPSLSFPAAIDAEGNSISYEYSIGTSSGGTEITNWTSLLTSGTTTLTATALTIPAQNENTLIYVNVRAKDSYNYYSTSLTSSFNYQLGWPYGLQSNITGSSGNCTFSSGNLTVSSGTCTLVAGRNYDFNNVTVSAGAVLQFVYDSASTYSLDPTNNPGQPITTTSIQKYTILGVKGTLSNNGSIIAEGSPFLHATSMTNTAIQTFTIPMPSGSLASNLSGVFIANSQSGNGSTYYQGTEYGTTNALNVPYAAGGIYGGSGGGTYLAAYAPSSGTTFESQLSVGPINGSNSNILSGGNFNELTLGGSSISSISASSQGLACGSGSINGEIPPIASYKVMSRGGHGGNSTINKYFCGAAGSTGMFMYIPLFSNSYANGTGNSYGGSGGGARGANGQILIVHSHNLITGTGTIYARGQSGGSGGNNLSCNYYDTFGGSLFFTNNCNVSGTGRGGNGAGGSGGKVYILSPDNTRYVNVLTSAGNAGTAGFGGANGSVGASTFVLAK